MRFLILLFTIYAASGSLQAADKPGTPAVEVVYTGDIPAEIRTVIEEALRSHPVDETEAAVTEYLFRSGYFSPDIEKSGTGDTLFVNPKRRAVIRSVSINPEDFPRRHEVQRGAESFRRRPFSQAEIERWIAEELEGFESGGRPFVSVEIDSIYAGIDEGFPFADVFISFSETGEITINRIIIEGNNETRYRTIYRQAGIFPGDLFSRERIDDVRPRLMRSGLFRSVSVPDLRIERGGGVLLLSVEETRFNSFDGIAGYVPAEGGGGYFTGLAHITMRNLFGTMRRVEFRWQRETESTQELFFKYREPFIGGLPAGVTGSFRQRQQDTLYVQTRTRLMADTEILRQFTIGLSYEHESVIPSADIPVQRVRRSSSDMYGIELRYDTRDDIFAPRSGMFYSTEYQSGVIRRSRGLNTDRLTLRRFAIDAEVYVSVVHRQVVKLGIYGREARQADYQESDLFRFGGTRTMRGFSEGRFTGSRVAWSNLEYRFMAARRSYMFVFFDSGYYYLPQLNAEHGLRESFEYGYGAGIQVETGIGLISVGFGFGRGDTFSTGKIHLGVIGEF